VSLCRNGVQVITGWDWVAEETLLLCHSIPPSDYLVPVPRLWLPFLPSWTFFLRGYSHTTPARKQRLSFSATKSHPVNTWYRFLQFDSPSSRKRHFSPRLQPSIIYTYILPPLLTHCPPRSPCQNLPQHTTPPPSSWMARPSNTTHWTQFLYKDTFLTSWHPFYLRPWRWDKKVFPKCWLYTKNWCRATTQKLLSNITTTADAFNYIWNKFVGIT
jgi:hypothetical protein